MKKILFLWVLAAFSVACSVEDLDSENPVMSLQELNASVSTNGCIITTFDYGTLGTLEIRNDRDFLYLKILASGENVITATSLDLADSFSGFPTVGKGNLQFNKMDHQLIFESGLKEYSFRFPIEEIAESIVIASYTTFNGTTTAWAGDIAVKQGNWRYFEYLQKEHPYNAGPDNSRTISLSEAEAMPSWDEVRKLYANMLAPGVDSKSGTYSPSIWEVINDFNDPNRTSKIGEYSTTYTLGSGDCTDSVVLTMIVIEDEPSL